MNQITYVTKHLLIINVIIYFAVTMLFPQLQQFFMLFHPATSNFLPIQFVTHFFMHGGISHLFFNMLSLYFFGPHIEMILGEKRFLKFYLLCGFAAAVLHLIIGYLSVFYGFSPETSLYYPMVGASGAIYGVLVAFAFFYPNQEIFLLFPPIPVKAKYMVGFMVLGDLIFGFANTGTGIAHYAHVGGAAFGLLYLWIGYRR